MSIRNTSLVAALALMAITTSANAAGTPPVVADFAKAVLSSCEKLGGHPGSGIAVVSDLNGDRSPEWVVVDGGAMCPGVHSPTPRPFTLTIFTTAKSGDVRPAFQRAAYGYRLERGVLWLASRGLDCGAASEKGTCDRPVQWIATAKIFDIVPKSNFRTPSQIIP